MITLILALFMSYAAVGILCYEAGADRWKRAEWEKASAEALDLVAQSGSRTRHPGGRDVA